MNLSTDEVYELMKEPPERKVWGYFVRLFIFTESGCWNWIGGKNKGGYGSYRTGPTQAQRVSCPSYRLICHWLYGRLPSYLHVDHLVCNNRACVNPLHLIPTTRRLNMLRSACWGGVNSRKTHCDQGHEFTPENTYQRPSMKERGIPSRACNICRHAADHQRWLRKTPKTERRIGFRRDKGWKKKVPEGSTYSDYVSWKELKRNEHH